MSDDTGDQTPRNDSSTPSNRSPPQTPKAENVSANLIEHFKANKIDSAMWATRLLTIIFAIGYVLPIFGTQQNAFNKVLLSNAATSALRLHQRLPSFTLSREFISGLVVEDSFHYLIFSLLFLAAQPTLLIIMPLVLFATLHASSYSLKLLDIIGHNAWWGARFLISLVEFQTINILKAVAFCEIILMPLAVFMVISGRIGIMTPFMYYHFLVMRYRSRRNPYTRNAFADLRMSTETIAARSPPMIAKFLRSGIALVSRCAPAPLPTTPNQ